MRAATAATATIALVLAPSCARGPTWYEIQARGGNPVYRCALSHRIGNREAAFDGRYRSDGTLWDELDTNNSWLAENEPETLAQLTAHFAALARDPVANCSLYEGEEGYYREHSFDCASAVVWNEGEEQFRVGPDSVGWSMESAGKRALSLSWSPLTGQDFAAAGFPWGAAVGPVLFAERPAEWGRPNGRVFDASGTKLIEDYHHETGEIRSGEQFHREWSTSNVALSVLWEVWPKLHAAGEPIAITLHDAEEGLTRRYTLPADFPRSVEAKLRRAYADARARERDPVKRCQPAEAIVGGPKAPEIIVY